MKKSSTLLFAAGLALTGCSQTPIEQCEKFTKEGNILGVRKTGRENWADNKCSDLKNEAAKRHCHTLMRSLRQKIMSACVTRQTGKPMNCKIVKNRWSCRRIDK